MWVEIGTAVATGAAKRAGSAAAAALGRVFQEESQRKRLHSLVYRVNAEQYLTSSSNELMALYREPPLSVRIGDDVFQSPVTVVVEPGRASTLAQEPMQFRLSSTQFEPPESIAAYTQPILRRLNRWWWATRLTNGSVVRLRRLERTAAGQWKFVLAHGKYFGALATNFAMDHKPENCAKSLRQVISETSRSLGSFEQSPLMNDIGVICLVESADGYLVVQKRSAWVANRPNTRSASVTGGLDWFDLSKRHTKLFLTDIAGGAQRETYAELGIESGELTFLGLVREFLRGGKPEMYFFGRSKKSFRDIKAARKQATERHETRDILGVEFHSEAIGNDKQSFYAFQDRARAALQTKNANLTLITGILLAIRRFDPDPQPA